MGSCNPLNAPADCTNLGSPLRRTAITPCRGFCQRVVHPDSGFFFRYHTQRGDKEVAVSPWQAHPVIGEVRELRFISPVSVRVPASAQPLFCCGIPAQSRCGAHNSLHGLERHCSQTDSVLLLYLHGVLCS